jgi:hypothetical protein
LKYHLQPSLAAPRNNRWLTLMGWQQDLLENPLTRWVRHNR